MKIITINLQTQYLNALQVLEDLGLVPSRSEAIRTALRNYLQKEFTNIDNLNLEHFKALCKKLKKEDCL